MGTRTLFLFLLAFTTCACSNTKHLAKGETLFTGSKVIISDDEASRKERKILINDMVALVRPKPNTKLAGMRVKLYLYNAAGNPKKNKGLRRWLRNKAGEPPVLASTVNLGMNKDIMLNYLLNRGFFFAKGTATAKVDSNKRKTTAIFNIATGPQYTINKTFLVKDSSAINHCIDSTFRATLLKEGAPYNLELIKAERVRIDKELKDRGYYYFKPDYLLVIADTSLGNNKVNMHVQLKQEEIPPEAFTRYSINDIYIYANYRLNGKNTDTSKASDVIYDGYHIVGPKKAYKPLIFSNALLFEKGDEYDRASHNATISRLINLGTFKFVKSRYEPVNDSLLNVYLYLTSYPKKSIRMQIGALTQNDNMAGSQASISWKNRNSFKGAEEFQVKVHGGFELQYSGIARQSNIYNYGAETGLSIPRFIVPFINIQTSNSSLPHSIVKAKYNYEAQLNLLSIKSYSVSYGYSWKEGLHKGHQLYPINITYVKTDTFGTLSQKNTYYSNLVFNGLIIGPTYEFTYNSQVGPPRVHSFYFNGLIDFSGNILGLAQKANFDKNPQGILGTKYAQYMKFQPDFRYYYRLSDATTIASRALIGLGIPYGNSHELPNIKQFWAGGNSDLRGFPSRLVGPGTYSEYAISHSNARYVQTLGDIKLEANVELRQHLYKFLNWAAFVDAGNIWLYNDNPNLPGGQFTKNFYKELAADAGLGLRFDFKILLLRLDLGIPIRKPWLPENERWVIKDIQFADPTWKKNNMTLNIGIGYPF